MTGIGRGSGGPPWSVDLLADLQAGALDPQQADELWPQVSADPQAQEILAALESTQADLREFAMAPAPPMPAEFAARLDAAIAAESEARTAQAAPPPQPAPVVSLDEARKRRNRRLGMGVGIFAAAAAAVGIAFAALPGGSGDGATNVASGPLNFRAEAAGPEQLQAVRDGNDYGPFSDKDKRTACLNSKGIAENAEPLGVKQATIDGKSGTLFLFASTPIGTFRLFGVDANCTVLVDKKGLK